MEKNKVLAEVERYLRQGNTSRAIFELKRALSINKKDLALKARLGDVYLKAGDKVQAKFIYSEMAREYAKAGFLIQAIAANKRILEIDPEHKETQKELARLYAQKAKETFTRKEIQPSEELQEAVILKEDKAGKKPEGQKELPKFPLFSDVAEEEFVEIVNRLRSQMIPAQKVIFKEGDLGDSIYLIGSGKVNVYKKDSTGRQVLLRSMTDGDFFGEFSYFANCERNVSVIAAEDTQLLELTRDELEAIVEKFPGVNNALVEFYKKRVLDTILGVTPVFRDLPYFEREKFLSKFELIIISRGADIVKEGEPGGDMFVIKSGEVEVWTKRENKKIVLATLKEGDFFGEISVITGEVRTATVTTLKECRLMKLNKADFDEIARAHPHVLKVARDVLDRRLADTITRVIDAEEKGLI